MMELRKFNKESRSDLELIKKLENKKGIKDSISIDMNLSIKPYIYKHGNKEGVVYLNSMYRCAPVFIDEPQSGFLRIEYSTIPYSKDAGDEYQKLISKDYGKDVIGKDLKAPFNEEPITNMEEIDVCTTD